METIFESSEDSSSPLMFDGSSPPDDLANVSFGSHLEYPDGSIPTVTKAHSGRMSPVRARTMKEYDQQIAELKKENFSLKLRIYFLEERVQQQFDGDHEGLFKTNINLKVEVESIKKDLMDKQDLLKKASHAMESLATQHQVEVQQLRDQSEREYGQTLHDLEEKLAMSEKDSHDYKRSLDDANQRIQELESSNKELIETMESQVAKDDHNKSEKKYQELIAEKDSSIEELKRHLEDMEAKVKDLEVEKVDTLKELQSRISALQNDMPATAAIEKTDAESQTLEVKICNEMNNGQDEADGRDADQEDRILELQEAMEDQRRKIEELEVVLEQMTEELSEKEGQVGRLEEMVRDREKSNKDLQNQIIQSKEDGKESAIKRDKAIQGLTLALHDKGKEVQQLCEKIEELESSLTEAKANLHQHHMSKYRAEEDTHRKLMEKEQELADSEARLKQKQLELERFEKNIGRKDTELKQQKETINQLEDAMQQSEDTLQELSEKLDQEKSKNKRKVEELENQYQGLVEDSQRQLQSKDKLVQQLTKSLREKDQQLQQYMDMVQEASNKPYTENKDLIISNLRERLKEREKALENAMEEKFKMAEEKDGDTRQNKMALRERDRDLERANQALLTAEETIDTLEREMKEKDQTMRQLTNALRAQQKALEEATENHVRGIEEKEGIIGKLQKSIANKGKYVEELINQQSPGGSDVVIEQLRQQITEKDRLLEEMMTERSKAAVANEKAANDLLGKLRNKDDEIKEANEDFSRQVAHLNKDLQRLQTDVNKKDYEIQLLSNRATWAEDQQQAMMDKMRAALGEKDKTIEALVESGREKDKMFRQMQESFAAQQPLSASRTTELQNLRDEVDRLQNELLSKEGLISRLRANLDRSPQRQVSKNAYDELESELDRQEKARKDAEHEVKDAKDQIAILVKQIKLLKERENEDMKTDNSGVRGVPERPSTPQRSETSVGGETHIYIQQMLQDQLKEAQNLSSALKAEKEVYANLSQSDEHPKSSYHHEINVKLSEIDALRQQLQESIRSNQELRDKLEKQLRGASSPQKQSSVSGHDMSMVNKNIESLRNQLEEAKRWNTSLQSRLNEQQKRGGGVGAAEPDLTLPLDQDNTEYMSFTAGRNNIGELSYEEDPQLMKMSPAGLRQEIVRLRLQIRKAQDASAEMQHRLSVAEDIRSIPGENNQDQAARNEASKLTEQVKSLEKQLQEAQKLNRTTGECPSTVGNDLVTQLETELQSVRNELKEKYVESHSLHQKVESLEHQLQVTAALSQSGLSPGGLDDSLLQLQHQLQLTNMRLQEKCAECEVLRQQLDPDDGIGSSQELVRLRSCVSELQHENTIFREKLCVGLGDFDLDSVVSVKDLQNEILKLEAHLKDSERANALLKEQIKIDTSNPDIPAGFNPDLLVEMSREVERLKKELGKARVEAKAAGKPPSGGARSQIPVPRRKSSSDSQDGSGREDTPRSSVEKTPEREVSLEDEVRELTSQKHALEAKLLSTESTVRSQTKKMKRYKGMLEDAGLLSKPPSRSQSLTNLLSDDGGESADNLIVSSRESSPVPRGVAGLNLSVFENFGESRNIDELQGQIKTLRGQVERYLRIIKSLKEHSKVTPEDDRPSSFRPVTPPSGRSSNGVPMGYPQTPGIDHFLALNQDAFMQLKDEVEYLKTQLRAKEEHNASLMDLLNMASPNMSASQPSGNQIHQPVKMVSIEGELRKLAMEQNRDIAQKRQIDAMKKRIEDGRQNCEDLGTRLTEIRFQIKEMLHQGDDGEVDMIDVTPERVYDLKKMLGDAAHLASYLGISLQISDHVESSDEESSPKKPALMRPTTRLEELAKKCSELETQNKKLKQDAENLRQKLAETNHDLVKQCKKLVEENDGVKKKLLEHDSELAKQCKRLLEENETARQRLMQTETDLGKKCASAESKYRALKREKDEILAKIAEKQKDLEEVNSKYRGVAEEVKELTKKNDVQATELAKLTEHGKKIVSELDEARRVLAESEVMRQKLDSEKKESEEKERVLQEKLTALESEINKLQAGTSALKQEAAENKQSRDQAKKDLQKRNEQYARLKEQLKKNKDAADENRKELHMLSEQIHEKDEVINQLKQKLRKMQQKGGRHLPRHGGEQILCSSDDDEDVKSSRQRMKLQKQKRQAGVGKDTVDRPSVEGLRLESDSDAVHYKQHGDFDSVLSSSQASTTDNLSLDGTDNQSKGDEVCDNEKDLIGKLDNALGMERLRHRAASGQPNGNNVRLLDSSLDYLSEGSTISSHHQHPSPNDRLTHVLQMNKSGGLVSEQEPISLNNSLQNISGLVQNFEARCSLPASVRNDKNGDPVYSERTERKTTVLRPDELGPRLRAVVRSVSTDSDGLQRELDILRSKLKAAEDLNETLRDELALYDNLSIRTAATLNCNTTSPTSLDPAGRENGQILASHLEEIRLLRERLEESIRTYDQLRQQLEERLSQMDVEDAVRIDSLQKDYANACHQYEILYRDLQEKISLLSESKDLLKSQDDIIRQKNNANAVLENKLREARQKLDDMQMINTSQETALKSKEGEVKTLKGEVDLLQDQVKTKDEQNRSLQSQVKSLEKSQKEKKKSKDQLDFLHLQDSPQATRALPGEQPSLALHGEKDTADDPLTTADLEKENQFPSRISAPSTGSGHETVNGDKESSITSVSTLPGFDPSQMSYIPFIDVSQVKVCSDLRYLYAIGKLDDYELLKKEVGESTIIIRGMEARIGERMKTFRGASPMQNLEYLTLKELSSSVENLNICLKEQNRIVRQFWTSQLPPKNQNGEYVDVRAWEENQALREKLVHLEGQYTAATKLMKNAQKRLRATNRRKENMEEAIYRSLAQTEKMMRQARSNLQNRNNNDDEEGEY